MEKERIDYIKGMDVSSLLEVEEHGGLFFDHGEKEDLFTILKKYGTNYVRLRLWNDPYSEDGRPYGAGTNDLLKTISLAKRAKAAGMGILLDYHYSDFWADPGKQRVPKAWRGLDASALTKKVYEYTKETLLQMQKEDVLPTMVQIGNEITNGLLWPLGQKPEYENIARFVSAGIWATREVDDQIQIMIHLDNGGNHEMYLDWFDHYCKLGADFDIIGLSYYPFWHGNMVDLCNNMNDIAVRYQKQLVIAEVSMGFTMEDYAEYEQLAPEERKGYATKPELAAKVEYPMTREGQAEFMQDLFQCLEDVPEGRGRGFFYWEPAWLPVPGVHWATGAALEYTMEAGPGGNEWANQALFDYDGNALPALEVIRDYEPLKYSD